MRGRVTDKVETLLKTNEAMRSDDRLLILTVWELCGFYLTPEQREKFWSLPSAESIRRVRQKLQENGNYPAKDSVKKQRKWKSMVMQQVSPKAKPLDMEKYLRENPF